MDAPVRELVGHKDGVLCLAASPHVGAPFVASGSEDSTCRVWDLRTSRSVRCVTGVFDGEAVNAVCWHAVPLSMPYGEGTVATTSVSGHLLYAAAGQRVFSFDLRRPDVVLMSADSVFEYNTDEVNCVVAHSGGQFLACGDDAGVVSVLDAAKGKLHASLTKHSNFVTSVAFQPRSRWGLASGSFDHTLVFWDFVKGAARHTHSAVGSSMTPPYVLSVAFSEDGQQLASTRADGSMGVYDTRSHNELLTLQPHSSAASMVEYVKFDCGGTPGRTVVTCGNDSRIQFMDVTREPPLTKKQRQRQRKRAAAAGDDGGEDPMVSIMTKSAQRTRFSIDHGSSCNWVTSTAAEGGSVLAADTGNIIVMYPGVCRLLEARGEEGDSKDAGAGAGRGEDPPEA